MMRRPNRLLASNRRHRAALAGLLGLVLVTTVGAQPEDRASAEAKLEKVRERIEELEASIESARNESGTLEQQLREIENDIAASRERLNGLRADIARQDERLQELDARRREYEQRLGAARDALARQMRAAYKNGRRDYLKLLLNQQDPALMGRMLTYYDYYSRARSEQIRAVSHELEQLAEIAREARREQATMAELEATESARLAELEGLEAARSKVIAHLNRQISEQREQLSDLREDQDRLQSLLEELRQKPAEAETTGRFPDFAQLEGKLDWPVAGKILNSFGSNRRGGALEWQGVRLGANSGDNVRAVSTGQVVFADWFRNLGLLLIIDHGDGYMTLYGHNDDLLKKRGDWVEDGEVIAHAGDSGGQDRPALYFEIRHNGKPVDPTRWCRR